MSKEFHETEMLRARFFAKNEKPKHLRIKATSVRRLRTVALFACVYARNRNREEGNTLAVWAEPLNTQQTIDEPMFLPEGAEGSKDFG